MDYYWSKWTGKAFRASRKAVAVLLATAVLVATFPVLSVSGTAFGGCGSPAALAAQDTPTEGMSCEADISGIWWTLGICKKVTITCAGEGIEIVITLHRVCPWDWGDWLEIIENLGIQL